MGNSGSEDAQRASPLQTVDRALSVLGLFCEADQMGVREIARRMGVSPTVVHRIMTTLSAHGFVDQDDDTRAYRLGPRIRELADRTSVTAMDVRRVALPHMRRLQDLTGETICLHTAQDGCRVCVAEIESPKELRMVVPLRPYPILRLAATDQIFRAFSDPGPLADALALDDDVPEQERRIDAGEAPWPDFDTVRERGWAVSYGVRIPGGISLAAPVAAASGFLVLSVFGPTERISQQGVEVIGAQATTVAAELAEALRVHHSPRLGSVRVNRPLIFG